MEVLGTVVLEVLKCIWGPSSRRIRDAKNLKENIELLKKNVEMHDARREDIKRKISGKKAENESECECWLAQGGEIQSKWKKIEEEYRKNMTCLGGWCPNVSLRLNLGKRTVALIAEVDESMTKSPKEVIIIEEPEKIMEMPAPTVEVNTAADRTLKELLGMLKEESIKKIGLCGMGGVGKTTLMKVLNNHPEITRMFEIVLWVTVSKEGTNRSVQEELARRLQVRREDGESNDSLKSKVFTALKAKQFLLLLDDVWNLIDLEEVGVPRLDKGNPGCKVVLSTRDIRVCRRMRTNKEIMVEPLSTEEAWSLFRREVGEVAARPEIEPLAKEVAEECCGLPLAVVVVGGALRNEEDIHVWRNALNELRSPGSTEIEDTEEIVYQRLKYSFDRLKDESSKECFLYCALFPEDYEIRKEQLVEYWINEGLIEGWSNSFEKAVDKGLSKVKELINASLLFKGGVDDFGRDCVKMHDVMRDLAIRISSAKSEGCRSLVKAGVKSSKAPKAEDWEKARRISLMNTHLETLPPMTPNCCMLTTLLLQENYELKEIARNFFKHMPALQVLDLSGTIIKSLPPSIGSLANLRGLYLNDCIFLKVIPSQVAGLRKLQIFEMKPCTEVCYLPPGMGDMVSLKHFEVHCGPDCNNKAELMSMFPRMSKLSGLERLGIHVSRAGAEWWAMNNSERVSQEISKLNKLTYLLLKFSKIEHFEHFVRESSSWKLGNLTSFGLVIDEEKDWYGDFGGDGMTGMITYAASGDPFKFEVTGKRILVCNDGTRINVSDEMREILTCVDTLVVGNSVVENLSDFQVEKMNMVKCILIGCRGMETIIFLEDDDDDGANGKRKRSDFFPSLQCLHLAVLPNLKSIWKGPIPHPHQRACFSGLSILSFNHCPMLKRIFPVGLIRHLSKLEELEVRGCREVEEIISMEEEENIVPIQVLLPRLKTLALSELPKLKFIVCGSKEVGSAGWPSLENVNIQLCGKLKSLPLGLAKAPNLQKIYCQASWWEALGWEDHAVKQLLCSKAVTY